MSSESGPGRPNRAEQWAQRRAERRAREARGAAAPSRPARPPRRSARAPRRQGSRVGLVWRAVPGLVALLLVLADGPQRVAGALALLGLVLAGERLVRLRRLGVADGVLAWTGGLLVVLVLTGVVLGSTSLEPSATGWAASTGGLGLLGLLLAAVLPRRSAAAPVLVADAGDPDPTQARGTRRVVVALLPWLGIAVAIAVLAVRLSAGSPADDRTPVSLSFGTVDGTQVELVLGADEAVGPFEIQTAAAGGANLTSYPLIGLDAAGQTTTTVSLPRTGRYVVTMRVPGEMEPLRTLVLDR